MSSFTMPLIVSPMPDGRRWRLVEPFEYHIGAEYSQDTVFVEDGFVTDFASSPFFTWSFIPPWGRYGKAAIVHDWLYQHKDETPLNIFQRIFSSERAFADGVFKEAMGVLGVKPWRIFLMYWGVRLFGFLAWK